MSTVEQEKKLTRSELAPYYASAGAGVSRAAVNNGFNPLSADYMKYYLRQGLVKISFIKKDGSVRNMEATLDELLIPEEFSPKGRTGPGSYKLSESEKEGKIVKVYEPAVEGWRTVIVDRVISFVTDHESDWYKNKS